jgi:hypothetical protein
MIIFRFKKDNFFVDFFLNLIFNALRYDAGINTWSITWITPLL